MGYTKSIALCSTKTSALCSTKTSVEEEEEEKRKMNEHRTHCVEMLMGTFPTLALSEGTQETPQRVSKMWDELLKGYDDNPMDILSKQFDVDAAGDGVNTNGIVVVKDIPFFSQCEHHLVPFYGKVSIAYLPREKVVGLSKFARLVECYARRLQVQERLTKQIITDIINYLNPHGAMVVVEAEHMCMTMRGIQKPGTKTVTSRLYGVFKDNPSARAEVLELLK